MLTLNDVVTRTIPPTPWHEGDNIPWNEPAFSERMLAEHLDQHHDLASRRLVTIENQVDWLLRNVISTDPARVLDLACGPGLYLNRLAEFGCTGLGIDFSPASIAHAIAESSSRGHQVEFHEDDIRTAEFGDGFDTALLLYGQLNVFRRNEALSILTRTYGALEPGGALIAEPQQYDHVRNSGRAAAAWSSHPGGLFSDQPHLMLTESFWDRATRTATQRFYIIDAMTGAVAAHSLSNEAYTEAELTALFSDAGFGNVRHLPSLTGEEDTQGLTAIIGYK